MKIPLEWLKEYVPVKLSPKALAERLTMAGLEVTGIEEGQHETVLNIEVTPNRADCLSILGVAREVAAITGQRLKLPAPSSAAQKKGTAAALKITIDDQKGCSRYIGRLIEGVEIKPSPAWMQKRLTASGHRPINNIVDITNYVLLEYGQPLHAFDFDRLAGGEIRVRRAQANEPITTLDGTTHKLPADALVIADAQRSVAVAGVMGGVGSEVMAGTKRVLLESARFDPLLVRRTARRLGLTSDSSYRFERGVDPAGVEAASRRAAQLILELAGGRETAARDVGGAAAKTVRISLDLARATQWLGVRIEPPAARTSLARLSCRVASASHGMQVTPPSFRQDLLEQVDLYEELARIIGYDAITPTLPTASIANASDGSSAYRSAQALRRHAAGLGLSEAITWSLLAESDLTRHGFAPAKTARLANPLSQDHAYIRPSLLPGLLRAVQRNVTQGVLDLRFFELGSVMAPDDVARSRESLRLGVMLTGWWSRDWREKLPADLVRLSGVVQQLVDGARLVSRDASWAEPGQAAVVEHNGHEIGALGQVSRASARALDIEQDVWFGELSVGPLLAAASAHRAAQAPPAFPPVKRDMSLLVSQGAAFSEIQQAIREAGGSLAAHVELIDRYTGKQVPAGQTSLTFSIEYRHPDRTLTASEADEAHQRIGRTLRERFGATLR